MRYNLLFILTLPIVSLGQGFILEDSKIIEVDYDKVDAIDVLYSKNNSYFTIMSDSIYLFNHSNKGLNTQTLKINKKSSNFNESSLILFNDLAFYDSRDKIKFHDLKKNKTVRTFKSNKKYRQVTWYTFEDDLNIYAISYYNNNDRNKLGHDYVYFYKISKKRKKIIAKKEIDIGKDILLAPLNKQLISFDGTQFIIASSISTELRFFDKDFNETKTIILNDSLYVNNQKIFSKIIPDSNVYFYLYKPKDLLFHYNNSELKHLKIINKIISLNENTLLISYQLKFRELSKLILYDINTNSIIRSFNVPYSGSVFSNIGWSTKIFANEDNELILINDHNPNDTTLKYKSTIFSYNPNKLQDTGKLNQFNIYDINKNKISWSNYSGVVLADDYFCKGCYSDYGTGKGVLVIKKEKFISKAHTKANYHYYKRNWAISGELAFVDEKVYNQIKTLLNPNILYPIDSLK